MKYLNHAWRWFATAVSFAAFGIGAFALSILMMPVALVAAVTPWGKKPATQRMLRRQVGRAVSTQVWLMSSLGVLDYDIRGYDPKDSDGPLLILANHPSLIDVVFLLSIFPEAQCVVKSALWRNPFTHLLMRCSGYISNINPEEILSRSVASLKRGNTLILFPEGTRSQPGSELDFKAGAATIAVRANVDVLPVLINVSPTTLTKADHWYEVPANKVLMQMSVKARIKPDEAMLEREGLRSGARRFNSELQAWFNSALQKEFAGSKRL